MESESFEYFAADASKASRAICEAKDGDIRDEYQIDRDRILYSKAFRRLRGKTQVFIAGFDDHVRNRLSHTFEVSQIARTIAHKLGLNEMLTEAIALGHDLGHTPFGHVGERVLHEISCREKVLKEKDFCSEQKDRGFKHNWQSVRVANDLEFHNRDYPGLNLTKETLWGFLHHSSLKYSEKKYPSNLCELYFYENMYNSFFQDEKDWSFEAYIVSVADEIAQRHHDVEDGLITCILDKAGLIKKLEEYFDVIENPEKESLMSMLEKAKGELYTDFYLETLAKAVVNLYVQLTVKNMANFLSEINTKMEIDADSQKFNECKAQIWETFLKGKDKEVLESMLSKTLYEADKRLQDEYLKKRILLSYQAQKSDGKAAYIIKKIVESFLSNPQQMPDTAILNTFIEYEKRNDTSPKEAVDKILNVSGKAEVVGTKRIEMDELMEKNECSFKAALVRAIVDYVAGMTDDYAIALYEQLYGGNKQNRY